MRCECNTGKLIHLCDDFCVNIQKSANTEFSLNTWNRQNVSYLTWKDIKTTTNKPSKKPSLIPCVDSLETQAPEPQHALLSSYTAIRESVTRDFREPENLLSENRASGCQCAYLSVKSLYYILIQAQV